MTRRSQDTGLLLRRRRFGRAADVGVGVAKPVERLARGPGFGGVWRYFNHALPGFGSTFEVLFAERANDTDVEQGLRVLRIDRERAVELGKRLVRLVRVVVRDPQIGADVCVAGLDPERILVSSSGLGEPARV